MPELSKSPKNVARRTKKNSERLELAPTEIQLAFHEALSGTPANTGYTLDFFEAIPKFRISRVRYTKRATIWATSFRWGDDQDIAVKIIPANIQRDPNSLEMDAVIPGTREELVWRVLVELAAEQEATTGVHQGAQTQAPFLRVRFSLTGLRDRLASRGKTYRVSEIKEALLVLKRAEIDVDYPAAKAARMEDYPNYISHLHFRGDEMQGGELADTCIAFLNPLATSAIVGLRCWPIDNESVCRLNLPLARWLITRIYNRYRQASDANVLDGTGYHLLLSTIVRESGMEHDQPRRESVRRVRAALAELKESGYFNEWKPYTEEVFYATTGTTKQRAIDDVKWTFFPSGTLIDRIATGNVLMDKKRARLAEKKRGESGSVPRLSGVSPTPSTP